MKIRGEETGGIKMGSKGRETRSIPMDIKKREYV
jgi:hypothetical protein